MLKRLLHLSILCLLGATTYSTAANATAINTEICDGTSGPVVNITTPLSDSIVNTSNIQLRGTAARTTQIDIHLNGSYSSSLAVGSSGQIDTITALNQGTNTISLQAYYSCNQMASTTTIIITYEPAAAPSEGSTTDTVLPQGTNQPKHSNGSLTTSPSDAAKPTASEQSHIGSPQPGILVPSPGQKSIDDITPENIPSWIPSALLAVVAVTPPLLLFALERFGGAAMIGGRYLPRALKWSIRGGGLILAVLLAAALYGVARHV